MKSFIGLGIGLSIVFGCLLLALVAELYYLLWWKKRISHTQDIEEDEYGIKKRKDQFTQLFCWKKPSALGINNNNNTNQDDDVERNPVAETTDLELGTSKDFLLKNFGEESEVSELMRLHNLGGPPRFLFTIAEETKEDLESEDGKSSIGRSRKGSRTASLSEIILTPLASPTQKSALGSSSYSQFGFNPLFESSAEADMNRVRSSPPPKFKFLRDAEEKLLKRLMEEAEKKKLSKKDATFSGNTQDSGVKGLNLTTTTTATGGIEEREGSFLKFIVGHNLTQHSSSSSQVLPLASSPRTTNFQTNRQQQQTHCPLA